MQQRLTRTSWNTFAFDYLARSKKNSIYSEISSVQNPLWRNASRQPRRCNFTASAPASRRKRRSSVQRKGRALRDSLRAPWNAVPDSRGKLSESSRKWNEFIIPYLNSWMYPAPTLLVNSRTLYPVSRANLLSDETCSPLVSRETRQEGLREKIRGGTKNSSIVKLHSLERMFKHWSINPR